MQLVGFFAFDMFGLFLEVFIVSQRKLKIDISLSFGQLPEPERSKPTRRKKIILKLFMSGTAVTLNQITNMEKLLVKCAPHVRLYVLDCIGYD